MLQIKEKGATIEGMERHVLIVEDEETASKALERKFQHSGFTTTTAKNGEEALNHLKTTQFDVMVLDLLLPKKDGYEVLSDMKQMQLNIPVVVLTNLCAEADIEKTTQLGAKKHFIKSMTPMKEVIGFIDSLLPPQ